MIKSVARKNRRSKKGKKLEETDFGSAKSAIPKNRSSDKKNGDFYMAGPAITLSIPKEKKDEAKTSTPLTDKKQNEESITPPSASGKGSQKKDRAYANGLTLEGRTDATFDGGSFETQNVRVTRAEDCETCAGQCVHVRGDLVARYSVTTTVTLPGVNDFPDLTACQRQRVQDAIDNVLAPHEQEHVRAFERYNGATRTPFDITLCRSEFDSTIRDMFEQQETGRRAQAQAVSDALDPFHFDVNLDCADAESGPPSSGNDKETVTESAEIENK